MPNESVNLYLSIQSGSSERTLTSLTDKTRALDKETQLLVQATEELAKANKPLREEQTRLQAQLKTSQKEVNSLQKAYDEYGDELAKLKLDTAIENHAKLKEQLIEVNAQLGANQKSYKGYLETVRKGQLSNSESAGLISQGRKVTASDTIAALGIGDKAAGLVQDLGNAFLTSAFGNELDGLVAGTLSNAISGGTAMGSIFGPLGALVGATAGGAIGLISGGMKIWEAQDDAFKEYYGGLYDEVKALSGETISTGSTIAGSREQTRMAFSQRLGGDVKADNYLAQVEKMAASTNYEYDEIVGYAKLLLNSYAPEEVFGVLQDLSDATAGLNLSSSDINMMISGLSRMRTTGKATQEYLNYFRERGIDTDQALADSLNVDKSSIADMVSKGQIGGEDAAAAILRYIQDTFGGLSDDLASTYDAMVDNLGDVTASLQAAGGDAYNELRKGGVQAEMDALGSELGDAIKEINAVMGENQARKENLQEQYMREVLDAVLNGTQGSLWPTFDERQRTDLTEMANKFAKWSQAYEDSGRTDAEAGAHMESLYEEAQALGKAYFENSSFMATLNDIEIDEITAIQENTAGLTEATQASYRLSQALSKGLAATWRHGVDGGSTADAWIDETGTVQGITIAPSSYEDGLGVAGNAWIDERGVVRRHAYGLTRVPYDNYPALLHEGERVLTAAEARAQDAGRGGSITLTITGNSFTGTSEEMADQLWEIIMRKLEQAYTAAAPK